MADEGMNRGQFTDRQATYQLRQILIDSPNFSFKEKRIKMSGRSLREDQTSLSLTGNRSIKGGETRGVLRPVNTHRGLLKERLPKLNKTSESVYTEESTERNGKFPSIRNRSLIEHESFHQKKPTQKRKKHSRMSMKQP